MTPDSPALRITVSGVGRAGKSVVIARIAELLELSFGPIVRPADLPDRTSDVLTTASASLRRRGLRIELVEVTTESAPQVDARSRAARLKRPAR